MDFRDTRDDPQLLEQLPDIVVAGHRTELVPIDRFAVGDRFGQLVEGFALPTHTQCVSRAGPWVKRPSIRKSRLRPEASTAHSAGSLRVQNSGTDYAAARTSSYLSVFRFCPVFRHCFDECFDGAPDGDSRGVRVGFLQGDRDFFVAL